MANPKCPMKNLLGKTCNGQLIRQHSGRRNLWVCQKNKKHKFIVGTSLHQSFKEAPPEEKKKEE